MAIVARLVAAVQPHQIYAAGDLSDPHGTHRVCFRAIEQALRGLAGLQPPPQQQKQKQQAQSFQLPESGGGGGGSPAAVAAATTTMKAREHTGDTCAAAPSSSGQPGVTIADGAESSRIAAQQHPWLSSCVMWLYRGAWQEWPPDAVQMAVPLSPDELRRKRSAIFHHQSQKDTPLFPGESDESVSPLKKVNDDAKPIDSHCQ